MFLHLESLIRNFWQFGKLVAENSENTMLAYWEFTLNWTKESKQALWNIKIYQIKQKACYFKREKYVDLYTYIFVFVWAKN